MKFEIWQEENEKVTETFLVAAGPMGEHARDNLEGNAKLLGVIEGDSHFETMTNYYLFMDWGEYKAPPDWDDVKDPYPSEWVETQNTSPMVDDKKL